MVSQATETNSPSDQEEVPGLRAWPSSPQVEEFAPVPWDIPRRRLKDIGKP